MLLSQLHLTTRVVPQSIRKQQFQHNGSASAFDQRMFRAVPKHPGSGGATSYPILWEE